MVVSLFDCLGAVLAMLNYTKTQIRYVLKIAIALTPWVVSMYALYWLGKNEIWAPETPHRDKITIAIVAAGMAASFFLHSHFAKIGKK